MKITTHSWSLSALDEILKAVWCDCWQWMLIMYVFLELFLRRQSINFIVWENYDSRLGHFGIVYVILFSSICNNWLINKWSVTMFLKKKIKRKPSHQLGNQFMVTKIRKICLYIFVVEKKNVKYTWLSVKKKLSL
jgi:hypothetical protein